MKLSKGVKSISYLKAHAAEMISQVAESGDSLVITQNGEAKAVLQDIGSWEQTQESLALLKMLAMSAAHEEAGLSKPAAAAFRDVRARLGRSR
ncbi:MAG: type II toxin-antitoxin system Phd/YefM family antitoxin [Gemmatimonadota bacterium]